MDIIFYIFPIQIGLIWAYVGHRVLLWAPSGFSEPEPMAADNPAFGTVHYYMRLYSMGW